MPHRDGGIDVDSLPECLFGDAPIRRSLRAPAVRNPGGGLAGEQFGRAAADSLRLLDVTCLGEHVGDERQNAQVDRATS